MSVASNKNKKRQEQAMGLIWLRMFFWRRWDLMETWKDSHSDICEQESLITGEKVDFMGVCLQGTLPSHSECFPLETCQPQNVIFHWSLNFLG